jgi:hypothetical protein
VIPQPVTNPPCVPLAFTLLAHGGGLH